MEDELWYMTQQSRILQEFRDDIRSLWEDEASRSINIGYLRPHEEDDAEMVIEFNSQHNNLLQSDVHRVFAIEQADIADDLSLRIVDLVERIDEDNKFAVQFEQQYRRSHASGRALLPEIDNLLEEANRIGNGAPPYEP